MNRELLSRAECNALRGLAILGIMLHNYCHWLRGAVQENEYQYFERHVDRLHQLMAAPDGLLPIHLLSFFGHYGVPVFLFLSAFGLSMKYERQDLSPQKTQQGVGFGSFLRYHYLKLFKMMIVGFVAFLIIDMLTPGPHHYALMDVVAMLGMFNNVLPHPDRIIWPGPYWFFGLMLQLYVIYRLVIYRRHWGWTAGLMVVLTLAQLLFEPEGEALNRYRYNFMGGMLPFGLGILYARYGERVILSYRHPVTAAVAVLVFGALIYAASDGFFWWMTVPALVCGGCVTLVKLLYALPWMAGVNRILEWLGDISAALFVCHPILRKLFIPISQGGDYYTGLLIYVMTSLCVAWLFREVMKKIPNPKLSR